MSAQRSRLSRKISSDTATSTFASRSSTGTVSLFLTVDAVEKSASTSQLQQDPPPVARRDNRVERWLREQQLYNDEIEDYELSVNTVNPVGTPCNPYLAYPQLRHSAQPDCDYDGASLADYIIVEEQGDMVHEPEPSAQARSSLGPTLSPVASTRVRSFHTTPRRPPIPDTLQSYLPPPHQERKMPVLHSARSWKSLNAPSFPWARRPESPDVPPVPQLPTKSSPVRAPIPRHFRAPSDQSSTTRAQPPSTDAASDMTSIAAPSVISGYTARLRSSPARPSTPRTIASTEGTDTLSAPRRRHKLKFMRSPSRTSAITDYLQTLEGHPEEPTYPSKPIDFTSTTTAFASRSTLFSSVHTFSSPSGYSASTPSLMSSVAPGSVARALSRKTSVVLRDLVQLSASSLNPVRSKRKKLVVSGVAMDDVRAVEGVRKWCESFGQLRQITRMPNGDLHVDFKKADVANEVCRLNAQVYISGVGSVTLSWYTGKKP